MGVFRAVWTLINVAAGVGDALEREYRGGGGDSSCRGAGGVGGTGGRGGERRGGGATTS